MYVMIFCINLKRIVIRQREKENKVYNKKKNEKDREWSEKHRKTESRKPDGEIKRMTEKCGKRRGRHKKTEKDREKEIQRRTEKDRER